MRTVQSIDLELDFRQPIAKFGPLGSVSRLVDFLIETQVEQPILLLNQQCFLSLQLVSLRQGFGLGIAGLRCEHHPKPVSHLLVLDLHAGEDFEHLFIELRFVDANAWMIPFVVVDAAVVDVLLGAGLGLLGLGLSGNRTSAVSTSDSLTGIRQHVRLVGVLAEQCLHTTPGRAVDYRLLFSGIPLAVVRDFTDVGSIPENLVHGASWKVRCRFAKDAAFFSHRPDDVVERHRLVSVEMENAADILGLLAVRRDHAATIATHVLVAIGSCSDEPALLNSSCQPFANVDRLLLGIEAGHVGQRAAHHASSRIAFGRLRNAEEGDVVFRFESFDFNEVEQVASCPVDLIDQQSIQLETVLLAVGDELAKGLAFVGFAGSLRNLEHADNGAALLLGVFAQGIFLNVEGKPFSLLFTAADASQGNESLHGGDFPQETRRVDQLP